MDLQVVIENLIFKALQATLAIFIEAREALKLKASLLILVD